MIVRHKYGIAGIALLMATTMAMQAQLNPKLKAQLDAASTRFHSATADVTYENYTRAARNSETETGSFFLERAGANETMGLVLRMQGAQSPSVIINYDGGTLHRYTPGTNQDDTFKAGANQAKIDTFLTLGFGGSGTDLERAWDIKDQGVEAIGGINCEKLDLVSKEKSVSNIYKLVTIWVDPTRGVSLKQMFFAPNGDTHTSTYSNVKLINGRVDKKPFTIPAKATKVAH